jgi:hypothetical protein
MRLQLTVSLLLNLLVCSIAGIGYAGINKGGRNQSRFRAYRGHPVQQNIDGDNQRGAGPQWFIR